MERSKQSRLKYPKTTPKKGPSGSFAPARRLIQRTIFTCTGLLFGAVLLCAQSGNSAQTKSVLFGPVGIVLVTTHATADGTFEDIGSTLGFGGGLHLRVYPIDAVALQFGATLVQRGAVGSTNMSAPFTGSTVATTSISYICLDAIANWLVIRGDSRALRLFAGPYMDVFTSGSVDVAVATSFGSSTRTETLTTEDVRSTGFGIAFGAGFDLNAGSGVFAFDARYDLGITDIGAENMYSEPVFNRGFQLQLSYLFRL